MPPFWCGAIAGIDSLIFVEFVSLMHFIAAGAADCAAEVRMNARGTRVGTISETNVSMFSARMVYMYTWLQQAKSAVHKPGVQQAHGVHVQKATHGVHVLCQVSFDFDRKKTRAVDQFRSKEN